jgi:Bacteriophage tail sheath protein
MPEYLSPGVYVEEVNTGSKPIEGVSTSTTGMVGVTERGPEDVPVLVTSTGDFGRTFGRTVRIADFTGSPPAERVHAYLPHAVQGFFTNSGRRAYIVRVLPNDATHAQRALFDRGNAASEETVLLRAAPQGSGTSVNPPLLYSLDVSKLAVGDWVRIGNGSRAEYRRVTARTAGEVHVALGAPLGLSYPASATVYAAAPAFDAAFATFSLAENADAGTRVITVTEGNANEATALALLANPILEIGNANVAEYIRATRISANGSTAEITLETPPHSDLLVGTPPAVAPTVRVIDTLAVIAAVPAPAPVLDLAANAGDLLVYPGSSLGAGSWLVIGNIAGTDFEVRRIGNFGLVSLDVAAYEDYPERNQIQLVDMLDDSESVAAVPAPTPQVFTVNSIGGLTAGMTVDINGSDATIQNVAGNQLTLVAALGAAPTTGDSATPYTELTADANAGGIVIWLANRLGLNANDVIRLGQPPSEEYATIAQINGQRGVAPDAGTAILTAPLAQDHADGTRIVHQAPPQVDNSRQATLMTLAAARRDHTIYISDETNYAANDIIRLTTTAGNVFYHRLIADATTMNPGVVELTEAVDFSHDAATAMVERQALIDVRAIDRGSWGNRLLVAVEDEEAPLVQAKLTAINPPHVISLNTFTGLEPGSVLELIDPPIPVR